MWRRGWTAFATALRTLRARAFALAITLVPTAAAFTGRAITAGLLRLALALLLSAAGAGAQPDPWSESYRLEYLGKYASRAHAVKVGPSATLSQVLDLVKVNTQ